MTSKSPLRPSLSTNLRNERHSPPKTTSDRNILRVVLGDLLFDTWYGSCYPDELVGGVKGDVDRLYVCRWCFRYSKELMPYLAHVKMCPMKDERPPGTLTYEKDCYSIYKVDGELESLYCQNLSMFAKMFLENKSVCFHLANFNYYLLVHTHITPTSNANQPKRQVVGLFSKEKMSWDNNNLACILVFPPWQKNGLGKILMGVSYELSKREGKLGGPEKPLSDLGKRGYLSFWSITVARCILSSPAEKRITVRGISQLTYILPEDVILVLKEMNVIGPRKRKNSILIISKAKVQDWVRSNRIDLRPSVDPEAFVEDTSIAPGTIVDADAGVSC